MQADDVAKSAPYSLAAWVTSYGQCWAETELDQGVKNIEQICMLQGGGTAQLTRLRGEAGRRLESMPVAGEKAAKWPFHRPLQVPQKVAHRGSAGCISGVITRSTVTWLQMPQ